MTLKVDGHLWGKFLVQAHLYFNNYMENRLNQFMTSWESACAPPDDGNLKNVSLGLHVINMPTSMGNLYRDTHLYWHYRVHNRCSSQHLHTQIAWWFSIENRFVKQLQKTRLKQPSESWFYNFNIPNLSLQTASVSWIAANSPAIYRPTST